MSDTYESWIYPPFFVSNHTPDKDLLAPVGIRARAVFHRSGGVSIVISKDEEQSQVAAGEPVQEELDQDIPLDFDLTEASFRGLPPGVDAGEKEWEKAYVGSLYGPLDFGDHYNPAVIPVDAEGAPIAGTAEEACATLSSFPATHWFGQPMYRGGRVESWSAEAEAKRWRGDMLHIISHCNICGDKIAGPVGEVHCSNCRKDGGLFDSFWRASQYGSGAGLEAWNVALREHPAWGAQMRWRLA